MSLPNFSAELKKHLKSKNNTLQFKRKCLKLNIDYNKLNLLIEDKINYFELDTISAGCSKWWIFKENERYWIISCGITWKNKNNNFSPCQFTEIFFH